MKAKKPQAPRPGRPMRLPMLDWGAAIEHARGGDVSSIVTLLKETEVPLSKEARHFLANALRAKGSRGRPGRTPVVGTYDVQMVQALLSWPKTTEQRAWLVRYLAEACSVTEAHIRKIAPLRPRPNARK